MIVAETTLEKIPEKCVECPLYVPEYSDYGYCTLTSETLDIEEREFRSSGCPLKEVPDNALH